MTVVNLIRQINGVREAVASTSGGGSTPVQQQENKLCFNVQASIKELLCVFNKLNYTINE